MTVSQQTARKTDPVVVETGEDGRPSVSDVLPADVAVVMVTWNRKEDVLRAVEALTRQRHPRDRMDVVVIDNASTDGTCDALVERWHAERIVDNPTQRAHEPAFASPTPTGHDRNAGGFRSLTVVRNSGNHGGCGGFNTGFAYVEHAFAEREPEFVWLVDDDVDLPPDALLQLLRGMRTDETIGLVGSRAVDLKNRDNTYETTIYFDHVYGALSPEPRPGHRLYESHREWVARVGGVTGKRRFTGLRDVDVVSACSMLARWSAVRKVGFWDWRFFIYCDDADWCLRFGRAGYRVVLNLDAVVYHVPWLLKSTPARSYYSQRNAVWMSRKALSGRELKIVTLKWMRAILRDSLKAGMHRRLFHAEILRRTASDIIRNRAGKLDDTGPKPEQVTSLLERCGALEPGQRVLVACSQPDSVKWAENLRGQVEEHLRRKGRIGTGAGPRWVYAVRNDVPDPVGQRTENDPRRIVYSSRWRSRLRRQVSLWRDPPRVVVVFDQSNDFPVLVGRWNLHIDLKNDRIGQLERDGVGPRARFLWRWFWTGVRAVWHAITVRQDNSATKYG